MNIECLAFMIRPNFKRLQKSLKSQVNWSYQLENLIQKWMRRSEHSYFQKCHRLSKVPRRDISQLTTGQTFRNVKLIRIFFQRFFFAPSVWRPSTLYWCNGQRSNATRLLWLLSLLSTQVQPNQSTAKCKFWILSDKDKIVNMNSLSSKIHKGKKHSFVLDFFFSLRFSDVFFICLYLFDRFSSQNLCNISLKFWCYDSERTLKC